MTAVMGSFVPRSSLYRSLSEQSPSEPFNFSLRVPPTSASDTGACAVSSAQRGLQWARPWLHLSVHSGCLQTL